jgi:hypothetical protein
VKRSTRRASKAGAVPATPDAEAPRSARAGTPAVALRRGARQRRSCVPNAQQEGLLPPELLQLVGGTLPASDLAAASLVCRLWSRSLREGGRRLAQPATRPPCAPRGGWVGWLHVAGLRMAPGSFCSPVRTGPTLPAPPTTTNPQACRR